jgi:hypothetical protein
MEAPPGGSNVSIGNKSRLIYLDSDDKNGIATCHCKEQVKIRSESDDSWNQVQISKTDITSPLTNI